MKRPERRLHLLLWLAIAPLAAAGLALALSNAPAAPAAAIDDLIVTDGGR